LGVFDFSGSFEGWVRRIIVNTAIDSIRKSKKNPFLSDQDTDFKQEAVDEMIEK
jgi:RNA polymerase sigma-70 factor (ECF subfamily)